MSFIEPPDENSPVKVEIKELCKGVFGKVLDKCFKAEGPYLLVKKLLDDYKGEEDGG